MKSILLKIDDALFEELEDSVKDVKVSKTAFIKEALSEAIKNVRRNRLAKELKQEITEIRKSNVDGALISDFETASLRDLERQFDGN